jgi:hypothetical protein
MLKNRFSFILFLNRTGVLINKIHMMKPEYTVDEAGQKGYGYELYTRTLK